MIKNKISTLLGNTLLANNTSMLLSKKSIACKFLNLDTNILKKCKFSQLTDGINVNSVS